MPQETPLTDTVLWIDGQTRICRAIEELFNAHDIAVVTAADAVEGLAYAHQTAPKLIVVHGLTPRLEYYALLAQLRSSTALHNCFVFVASDPWDDDDMSDLLACGADATIERPIDPDLVMEIVAHVFTESLTSRADATSSDRKIRYFRR